MKVFISWSGEKSKTVALALREFIPDVIQAVEPWMSKVDIKAGDRWQAVVAKELQETKFGVICLTPTNSTAPWILFEAGALAKTLEKTYVCPYVIDMEPTDIPDGPLNHFQGKRANKIETKEMIIAINAAMEDKKLDEKQLERSFNRCWPDLEHKLKKLPNEKPEKENKRTSDDMVREILAHVRAIARTQDTQFTEFSSALITIVNSLTNQHKKPIWLTPGDILGEVGTLSTTPVFQKPSEIRRPTKGLTLSGEHKKSK